MAERLDRHALAGELSYRSRITDAAGMLTADARALFAKYSDAC